LLARSNNIEHGSLTDRVLQEFGNPSRGFGQRPPVLFRMDSQDEPSARFIVGVDQTVATFAAVFADDAPASLVRRRRDCSASAHRLIYALHGVNRAGVNSVTATGSVADRICNSMQHPRASHAGQQHIPSLDRAVGWPRMHGSIRGGGHGFEAKAGYTPLHLPR